MAAGFESFEFINVWKKINSDQKSEIQEFWKNQKALPQDADVESRLEQVVFIVKHNSQGFAGVCTALPTIVQNLGFRMYFFRTLIHPEFRQNQLAKELLYKTRVFLNDVTDTSDPNSCKGIILESENPIINKVKNETVWPYSGMIYIGRSQKGNPIRIHYFDNTRIEG